MSTCDRQLTRQACLDDELPLEEVIAFEEQLTAADRRQLQAEREFERELAERLSQPAPCPEALWQRLETRVKAQGRPALVRFVSSPRVRRLAAAAAIALLLGLGALLMVPAGDQPPTFAGVKLTASLSDFAAWAETTGSAAELQASLAQHGFHVRLADPASTTSHHQIKLLGMRYVHDGKVEMAQVMFDCCGQPVSVFVAPARCSWAPALPEVPANSVWHSAERRDARIRLIGVGPHRTDAVLDLFS